jgi:hypothetical protein
MAFLIRNPSETVTRLPGRTVALAFPHANQQDGLDLRPVHEPRWRRDQSCDAALRFAAHRVVDFSASDTGNPRPTAADRYDSAIGSFAPFCIHQR